MTSDSFIKLPDSFTDDGSEYHLTPEELYTYCLIYSLSNLRGSVQFNIDLLSQLNSAPYAKQTKEAKSKVKKIINNLIHKKVITNYIDGDFKNVKSNTELIDVDFEKIDENSFYRFSIVDFDKFDDMYDCYVYCAVAKWSRFNKEFKCDLNRWASILQVSKPTAIKYLQQAIDRNVIYVNTGEYTEKESKERKQKLQEKNSYQIKPFKDKEKTFAQKKKENKKKSNVTKIDFKPNKFKKKRKKERIEDIF
ncbi:hypothetical protein [Alteribacillus sp. YIM 98480]|uniref:hypothetical protein n=1 Tax=Alteribacillus sp. YIM 98480 TaxID=2606599 RepID=UPI00131D5C2E|nr:hypothetical protein [Alteribacillus sp. YIM 98480]